MTAYVSQVYCVNQEVNAITLFESSTDFIYGTREKSDTVISENRAKSMSLMIFKETILSSIIDYAGAVREISIVVIAIACNFNELRSEIVLNCVCITQVSNFDFLLKITYLEKGEAPANRKMTLFRF